MAAATQNIHIKANRKKHKTQHKHTIKIKIKKREKGGKQINKKNYKLYHNKKPLDNSSEGLMVIFLVFTLNVNI